MTTTNQTIAQTILTQLGGNRFIAMTGAKNLFTSEANSLSFDIGKNQTGARRCLVSYWRGQDLYDMCFLRLRGTSMTYTAEAKGIQASQLIETFERLTGMATSL